MLSELSSTEIMEWAEYFSETFFSHSQLDAHFASLEHLIVTLKLPKHHYSISDFSLLSIAAPASSDIGMKGHTGEGMSDEQIMQAAEGIPGGMRFGPE